MKLNKTKCVVTFALALVFNFVYIVFGNAVLSALFLKNGFTLTHPVISWVVTILSIAISSYFYYLHTYRSGLKRDGFGQLIIWFGFLFVIVIGLTVSRQLLPLGIF